MYSLGQITQTDPALLYRELHATAVALNQAKQRFQAATTAAQQQAEMTNVQNLVRHFQEIADAFRRSGADQDALSLTDRVILATGEWIGNVLSALPGTLTAVPKVAVDALADLLGYVGKKVGVAALPWAVIGLGAIGLLLFAERSRTFRLAAARGMR